MRKPRPDPRLFIQAVEKAMHVLNIFRYDQPISIIEVANLLEIGRSAAQRYVHTWHVLNYIQPAPSGKGYVLAPRTVDVGARYLNTNPFLERAYPYLVEVNRRTREKVGWGELDDADFMLLYQIPSQLTPHIYTPFGARYPAIYSTSGLAILAFLPQEQADSIIERCVAATPADTPYTALSKVDVQKILKKVRKNGFCITQQLLFDGRISVSAPIFDGDGRVISALHISTLLERYSLDAVEERLAPVLLEAARAISDLIGRQSARGGRANSISPVD